MAERLPVQVTDTQATTALIYRARSGGSRTLVLGHGAGAGQESGFMVTSAEALAARGLEVVTFNFLYTEHGRGVPDRAPLLEACYRAVVDALGREVAVGGKSMGGRIASHLAAAGHPAIRALVFLGYPLHPPGRPDKPRTAHLPNIVQPMLFVQGTRDPFGTPEELQPILAGLRRATLHPIPDGDHGFKVRKAHGPQARVMEGIYDTVAEWLSRTWA